VEIRRGRSLDQRLERGRRIVDVCTEVLSVRKKTVLVEFTVQTGRRDMRDGECASDQTPAEAMAERSDTAVLKGGRQLQTSWG
jgi:hypothetical protein